MIDNQAKGINSLYVQISICFFIVRFTKSTVAVKDLSISVVDNLQSIMFDLLSK